ncbi:glycosyltransferase family 2 protein [Agromyces atrinae]|uniref:Glycosyltransferase family 2 protein n=1 Tax=Agromyces atrinae TaxID=592376 RepID=A0A4V1R249_9MICO|nr:glycosyltransferase family 2 protein [Agromyces atrinae]NYD68531.1 glycosyltransferase involved in cell wall biosynthesis [Agromyces atrinae]RXZ85916.1 glycosyltransferase family 2 protein [Agromyces atrinae]
MSAKTIRVDVGGEHETPTDDGRAPAVSVIIPVFNALGHLESCIAGLQSLLPVDGGFEVIIVDDGSRDGSGEVLSTLNTTLDLTVLLLSANVGAAEARNVAIRHARGEYLWMVDADDRWPAHALRSLHDAARAHDADVVIAQAQRLIVASGERVPVSAPRPGAEFDRQGALAAVLRGEIRGHLWNKLFRRSVVGQSPFPRLRSKSDYFAVIDIAARSDRSVTITDSVYEYVYQAGSISNSSIATPLDLFACYDRAMAAIDDFGREEFPPVDVVRFGYFSIAQIALAETWRFGDRAVGADEVRARVRRLITVRGIATLVAHRRLREAALAAAMRFAPGILRRVFLAQRSHRW